jgi:hypothetical protein
MFFVFVLQVILTLNMNRQNVSVDVENDPWMRAALNLTSSSSISASSSASSSSSSTSSSLSSSLSSSAALTLSLSLSAAASSASMSRDLSDNASSSSSSSSFTPQSVYTQPKPIEFGQQQRMTAQLDYRYLQVCVCKIQFILDFSTCDHI